MPGESGRKRRAREDVEVIAEVYRVYGVGKRGWIGERVRRAEWGEGGRE